MIAKIEKEGITMYVTPSDRFWIKLITMGGLIILTFISEFIFGILGFKEMIGASYVIVSFFSFIIINRWLSLISFYNDNTIFFIVVASLVSLLVPWIVLPLNLKSTPIGFNPRTHDFIKKIFLDIGEIFDFIFEGGLSNFFWGYTVENNWFDVENLWFIASGILHIIIFAIIFDIYYKDIKNFYKIEKKFKYNYIVSEFFIVFSLLSTSTLTIIFKNYSSLILFGYCMIVSCPVIISFITERQEINVFAIIFAILVYLFVFFLPFFICAWLWFIGIGICTFLFSGPTKRDDTENITLIDEYYNNRRKFYRNSGNVILDEFGDELYVESDGSVCDIDGFETKYTVVDEGTYFRDNNGKIHIKKYYYDDD